MGSEGENFCGIGCSEMFFDSASDDFESFMICRIKKVKCDDEVVLVDDPDHPIFIFLIHYLAVFVAIVLFFEGKDVSDVFEVIRPSVVKGHAYLIFILFLTVSVFVGRTDVDVYLWRFKDAAIVSDAGKQTIMFFHVIVFPATATAIIFFFEWHLVCHLVRRRDFESNPCFLKSLCFKEQGRDGFQVDEFDDGLQIGLHLVLPCFAFSGRCGGGLFLEQCSSQLSRTIARLGLDL